MSLLVIAILCLSTSSRADELAELTAKAEKEDADSQFQLAQHYADGKGVTKDDAQALAWFKRAAEHDLAAAEVSLGSIYAHGFGVKSDWAESIRWYRKAALQGDPVALHNLGLDYNYGHGVPQDYELAANFYRLGAEQGQPRCQYNLGKLYEDGHGVPQSDADALLFYTLATAHDNQVHIFGAAKAKEVLELRDRLAGKLTPAQLEDVNHRLKAFQALVPINPRRFGSSNTGISRGWYIWHSFNSETWEAEVSKDLSPEIWKVRVLPWCSTYRYLNYGVHPEQLLPGERVNIFFDPDEKDRHGFIDYFQDEICQMIGHGHYWQIRKADKDGIHVTAVVMAGDKLFDPTERDFILDPRCAKWKNGDLVEHIALAENDHVYLTWCLRDGMRRVMLFSDRASIDAVKKYETDRMAMETTAIGLGGQLQSIDGDSIHLMIFSTYWSQASHLKPGDVVRISATGKGYLPEGDGIEAKVTFRKNRGTYGSGVTDMLLQLSHQEDAQKIRKWLGGRIVRMLEPVR